jgi:hypothetical protein
VAAPTTHGDTSEAARAAYDEAQALKRSNRFNESRETFQRAAEFSGPGASNWAALAGDELRYGLPLHEAGYLSMQLTQIKDFPGSSAPTSRRSPGAVTTAATSQAHCQNQRRRDQLAAPSGRHGQQPSTTTHLEQLRQRGNALRPWSRWPDRRLLEQRLVQALLTGADRMYIVNYYPSRGMFTPSFATNRATRYQAQDDSSVRRK